MASFDEKAIGDLPPVLNREHNSQSMDTRLLGREVLRDIFHNSYRFDEPADHPINKKLRSTYLREFKTPLVPTAQAPFLALGGPGEGKTSTFRGAAEKFSKLMGLNFVDTRVIDPLQFKPKPDDFLWAQLEMGGEISPTTTGGAPVARKNAYDEEVVVKAINGQLDILKRGNYAFFSLDDIANANQPIINAMLPIVEEKGVQGHYFGSHLNLGLTGNIAGKDGSSANQVPSPLVSRCKTVDVYDKLSFFCERLYNQYYSNQYHDSIKDAGVAGFLLSNPEYFRDDIAQIRKDLKLKPKDTMGQFAAPRTWRNCINSIRGVESSYLVAQKLTKGPESEREKLLDELVTEMDADELSDAEKKAIKQEIVSAQREIIRSMPESMEQAIKSTIGVHGVGGKFYTYTLQRLQHNTVQMAEEMMRDGELSKDNQELFRQQYEHGDAEQAKNFGYAWTAELGKAAAQLLAKAIQDEDTKRVTDIGQKLGTGILAPIVQRDGANTKVLTIDEGEVARTINSVMQGLASSGIPNGKVYRGQSGQVVLHGNDVLKPLMQGINKAPTAKHVHGKSQKGDEITRAKAVANILTNCTDSSDMVQNIESVLGKLEQLEKQEAGSMPKAELQQVARETAHEKIMETDAEPGSLNEQAQDRSNDVEPNSEKAVEQERDMFSGNSFSV